jgi:Fic family protein
MNPTKFVASEVGRVIKGPGRWGFHAFVPAPIPRVLSLESETVLALSAADTALGRLAGAGRLLPNPHLLVDPYVVREAVASSRIEGTQASLSEVLQATAIGTSTPGSDVREVQNYVAALNVGLRRLAELPLCLRLIREVHEVLMEGVRGQERGPGKFRSTPNWIGSPTDTPDNATFVPPLPDDMEDALDDLEHYLNDDVRLPVLIRCALVHYQFETIHPFLDGNGRLGRLLAVFYLVQQQVLPQPLLYLSAYFETHRGEYYDRLQAVRERGEIQEWLQFFLTAVAVQATDAIERAERLADLRERYRRDLAAVRSRAPEVMDLLMANPFITVRQVETSLGVTQPGALNLLRGIQGRGWLRDLGTIGRGGRAYWVAPEVLEVIADVSVTPTYPAERIDRSPDALQLSDQ